MTAKAPKRAGKAFYRPLGWGVLRAPLLPVEAYSALSEKSSNAAARWQSDAATLLPADPWVRLALAVGGGHLVETLGDEDKKDADAPGKLLRYQIRMSTRPTPYGIFAGVALAKFVGATDVLTDASSPTRRARPDMEWLFSLVGELEARPEVRRQLRVMMHPAAFVGSGRVFLADPTPLKDAAHLPVVSIRESRAVSAALGHAKDYVQYASLAENLCRELEADAEKVDKLLTELWQQGLLLTELRPPLTDVHPADYVAQRLLSLAAPPPEAERLKSAIAVLNQWDVLDPYKAAMGWPALEKTLRDIHPLATTPIQVDLSLSTKQALVNVEVANEAARLADILLRMTPAPPGSGHLGSYRAAFEGRYGHGREVPLLELLDPNFGLGPPTGGHGGYGGGGMNGQRMAARNEFLQSIALSALSEHRTQVELDDAMLKRLSTWDPEPESLPLSLDLSVFVIAGSADAVDEGKFQIALGPNLGAGQAGRYLGRFADLLGQSGAEALAEIARAEAEHFPDAVWAELVYMPRRLRSGNVVVRPDVRGYEIPVGIGAGVPEDRVIPLSELTVGIHNGRFQLRWRRNGNIVIVRAGHMLTNFQAPQICRFLSDIMEDGLAQISMFDWGPASSYPFLPRVISGRAILSPARWRITQALRDKELPATGDGFLERLAGFRKSWNMPRHVYVAIGDNRLMLDLGAPDQANELRTELAGLRESGSVVLHEALPAPEHAWVRGLGNDLNEGADGHYLSELVVPLVLPPFTRKAPAQRTATEGEEPKSAVTPVSAANRLRPPGSDWLFAKLYCPAVLEEEFLTGEVRDFCYDISKKSLTDGWFFVRYNDPDPHIRLRFRGDPNRLIAQLLPEVCSWGGDMIAEGICQRVAFDTYDREIERYGGAAGMSAVEAIFTADSPAAVDLLAMLRKKAELDRLTLAVASIDDLLKSMGLDVNQRLAWYKARVKSPHSSGMDFRERKTTLRVLIGSADGFAKLGAEVIQIFAERQRSLAPIAKRIATLEETRELSQTRDIILQSVIHMHCNRLAGADRGIEERALGLLLRVHQSLNKAPV